MITKHLGYQIDISCGGIDNIYRHHDYNIAVIEGVSGKKFANYWLHAEHVLVDGVKMSKSRGNIVHVQDVIDSGVAPHHLRFYLIYGHYRDRLNLSRDRLHLARGRIDTFRDLTEKVASAGASPAKSDHRAADRIRRLPSEFERRMNDDLDVKGAFDALYDSVEALATMAAGGGLAARDRRAAAKMLGRIDGVLQVMR
jgi:cysteinyl-tRNA synthetase